MTGSLNQGDWLIKPLNLAFVLLSRCQRARRCSLVLLARAWCTRPSPLPLMNTQHRVAKRAGAMPSISKQTALKGPSLTHLIHGRRGLLPLWTFMRVRPGSLSVWFSLKIPSNAQPAHLVTSPCSLPTFLGAKPVSGIPKAGFAPEVGTERSRAQLQCHIFQRSSFPFFALLAASCTLSLEVHLWRGVVLLWRGFAVQPRWL